MVKEQSPGVWFSSFSRRTYDSESAANFHDERCRPIFNPAQRTPKTVGDMLLEPENSNCDDGLDGLL